MGAPGGGVFAGNEVTGRILAWREERTVTRNLTLHYDRMMLMLEKSADTATEGEKVGA